MTIQQVSSEFAIQSEQNVTLFWLYKLHSLRIQIFQILSSNSQELKKFQYLIWKTFTHYKSLSYTEELYFRYS